MSNGRPVIQYSTVTPGHVVQWTTDGIVQDAGPATNGTLTEAGITKNGGIALGIRTFAPPAAYNFLGWGVEADGTTTMYVESYGGAPASTLYFNINGISYPFNPSSNGNITGPTSAVSGDIVVFNGNGGNLVEDSGVSVSNLFPAIASIAALRASTTASFVFAQCYVLGYRAEADGGEGVFVYISSDTTSADNGGTIIVDASGRRWHRETGGEGLNPFWFGFIADGSTDNTAAWANIEAVSVASGRAIVFPAGKFSFASAISYTLPTLSASCAIVGAGPGVTELMFPTGGGLTVNCVSGANSASFNNAFIANMSVTTGTQSVGTAIQIVMTGNSGGRPGLGIVNLYGLDIRGSDGPGLTFYWQTGIGINGVSNVAMAACAINGPGVFNGGGVGMDLFGTADNIPVEININSCEFYNLVTGLVYGAYVQGVNIYQSTFTGGTVGIQTPDNLPVPGVQLIIAGNQFETNASNGNQIVMNSIVADLIIRDNLLFVTGQNGIVLDQSERTSIVGNHIEGVSGVTGSGMFILGQTNSAGIITGNLITGFPNGIALSVGTSGWNVQSNFYEFNTVDVSDNGTGNTLGLVDGATN